MTNPLEAFFDTEGLDLSFNFEENKNKLVKNLDMLKNMSVEEQTFYKKWLEVKNYRDISGKSGYVKAKIWTPTDINNEDLTVKEIEQCNPTMVFVDTPELNNDWTMLRVFGHTMSFDQTPGRFLKFLVTDGNKENPKYIGLVSVSSDVIAISDRDNYIKWTKQNKLEDKRLTHSAIGSCIMSTQPIGYNFLGGKLIAAMITTSGVRDKWESLYNQKLVGMTTTSLYGSYSMYNSLKWWHKCGSSAGKIAIKPDDEVYNTWMEWLKTEHSDEFKKAMTQKEGVSGPVTGAKSRTIAMIFSKCGIKQSDYVHGYQRGVYYSCFYENTKEFLQNKINEDELKMKPLFEQDVDGVINWWKSKAKERYKKLKQENRLKPDIHFYNKMIDMDYETAKQMYFNEVGR
jgi:hypothetical protein